MIRLNRNTTVGTNKICPIIRGGQQLAVRAKDLRLGDLAMVGPQGIDWREYQKRGNISQLCPIRSIENE